MQQEIERFLARSEDVDYEVTIVILQEFIDVGHSSNPNAVIPGLKRVQTTEGFACNWKSDDTFEVVNDPYYPGMIVKRIS